jgi:methylated-DNA-[protein]-cysteine S-methyltransferase
VIDETSLDKTVLYQTQLASPVGLLTLVVSERGLRTIVWNSETADREQDREQAGQTIFEPDPAGVLAETIAQLQQYFAGTRRYFDLPLDPVGTPFQQQAWLALRTIPYGETVTYGEQARRLGDPNKARAVGAANGRNPLPIVVPCHRVVGSNGSLTGFGGGLENKAWLLDHERFNHP